MNEKLLSDEKTIQAERLSWNLAVCECLILGSCKPDAFNKELALDATLKVNDFVKSHRKKVIFLRKKREHAENQLSIANNRIKALLLSCDMLLDQRSADYDEINRLERSLKSANSMIGELKLKLQEYAKCKDPI